MPGFLERFKETRERKHEISNIVSQMFDIGARTQALAQATTGQCVFASVEFRESNGKLQPYIRTLDHPSDEPVDPNYEPLIDYETPFYVELLRRGTFIFFENPRVDHSPLVVSDTDKLHEADLRVHFPEDGPRTGPASLAGNFLPISFSQKRLEEEDPQLNAGMLSDEFLKVRYYFDIKYYDRKLSFVASSPNDHGNFVSRKPNLVEIRMLSSVLSMFDSVLTAIEEASKYGLQLSHDTLISVPGEVEASPPTSPKTPGARRLPFFKR